MGIPGRLVESSFLVENVSGPFSARVQQQPSLLYLCILSQEAVCDLYVVKNDSTGLHDQWDPDMGSVPL